MVFIGTPGIMLEKCLIYNAFNVSNGQTDNTNSRVAFVTEIIKYDVSYMECNTSHLEGFWSCLRLVVKCNSLMSINRLLSIASLRFLGLVTISNYLPNGAKRVCCCCCRLPDQV